jgi:hypothetical protein
VNGLWCAEEKNDDDDDDDGLVGKEQRQECENGD